MPPNILRNYSYALEIERYNRIARSAIEAYSGFEESKPYYRATIIRSILVEHRAQELVNIGPGFGYLEDQMQGFPRVAVDQSEEFLKLVKKRSPDVICVNGIAEALPFCDQSVRCLVSDSTFQSVNNRVKFLYEIARVTAPGALIILSIAYKWDFPRKPQDGFNITLPNELDILKHFISELGFEAEYKYLNLTDEAWKNEREEAEYLWIIGVKQE